MTSISIVEKSIVARALKKDTGEPNVHDAVRAYLRNLVRCRDGDVGCDLQSLAHELGVRKVLVDDLVFDGILEPLDDKHYRIRLNRWTSHTRRRYTLAHELGHIVLHRVMPDLRSCEKRDLFTQPDAPAEERLCDMIAAEILMPEHQFCAEFCEGISIDELIKVARKYKVSLAAAAYRIRDLSLADDFALGVFLDKNPQFEMKRPMVNFQESKKINGSSLICGASVREVISKTNGSGDFSPIWLREMNVKRRLFIQAVERGVGRFLCLLVPSDARGCRGFQ